MPRPARYGYGAVPLLLVLLALLVEPGVERAGSLTSPPDDAISTMEASRVVARDDADEEDAETELTLPATEHCVDAGYLCDSVEEDGSLQVVRFPVDTDEIRVHVPLPEHESREYALRLQEAARRGLDAWEGHPFPVRFVRDADDADVVVTWEAQLPHGGLGETKSRFRRIDGSARYRVLKLALATRSPYRYAARLRPADVELTAAHEMGHVLGLPHSRDRSDLMYPTDAATSLSERDFRTVEALYRIPNGAHIVR